MNCVILTVDSPIITSMDKVKMQLKRCIDSVEKIGYEYELYYGPVSHEECIEAGEKLGIKVTTKHQNNGCQLSHAWAFNQSYVRNEPLLILEYDAILNKPIDFKIKDNHFYLLHKTGMGHGHIITPTQGKYFVDMRRNEFIGWISKWNKRDTPKPTCAYDHLVKRKSNVKNLVIKSGYVGGNEVDEWSTRIQENRTDI